MSACGSDFGLRVLDRAGSSTEGNPQTLKACFELETGKLEQFGRLPEIDVLVEVVTEHPGFMRIAWAVGASAGGTKGEGPQKPVIQSIQ
jgi:hypothetical protein